MGRGHSRGEKNPLKVHPLVKHGSRKKYKRKLHKLRGLKGNASKRQGELRPKALISHQENQDQGPEPNACVGPCKTVKLPKAPHEPWNQPGHSRGSHSNSKLPRCPFHPRVQRKAGQHDQACAQEHAGIVYQKSRYIPVDQPGKADIAQEKYGLGTVKCGQSAPDRRILPAQVHDQVGQEMNGKHGPALRPAAPSCFFLILRRENAEIGIRIDRHQKNHQIFGYFHNQVRHRRLLHFASEMPSGKFLYGIAPCGMKGRSSRA